MRALTLWPEWAWAVAHLGKDVENRGWAPPFWVLGQRIAVHAGRNVGGKAGAAAYRAGTDALREAAIRAGLDPSPLADWVNRLHRELCETTSAVVAVARVEYSLGISPPSRWAEDGQKHWRLAEVVALPRPVPCRGAQGLWVLPRAVEDAVVEQIGGPR